MDESKKLANRGQPERWVQEMVWATKERKRIAALNDPIYKRNKPARNENARLKLENRAIAIRNRAAAEKGLGPEPLHMLLPIEPLHKLPWLAWQIIDREFREVAALTKRTPAEWSEAVRKLDSEALQRRVACIVWWDYLSLVPTEQHIDVLDDLKDAEFVDVPEDELARGLREVGYTPFQAHKRSKSEDLGDERDSEDAIAV